jgi:OOP family OmpA-OmpF porin
MKKSLKLGVLAAAALLAACASAPSTDKPQIAAKKPEQKGYVQSQFGGVVVGQFAEQPGSPKGACVRTQWWDAKDAQVDCNADLMPKPAPAPSPMAPAPRPAAPAPAAKPPVPPAAKPAARPAPAPTSEKVTFAADAFFDFDKAVLKPEGKSKLDGLVGQIKGITLEVVIAVGHTDSVGSDAYNQKLSLRRAEAVKAYMVSKGIEANRVYTEGKGKKQPVADNKTADGRAKNRRVEIEVVGTRAKK